MEDHTVEDHDEIQLLAGWRKRLELERDNVKFRLRYDGPLPSASRRDTRCKEKNQIRWRLHHQLATVVTQVDFSRVFTHTDKSGLPTFVNKRFKGYGFMALISTADVLVCDLSIQLERRDFVGGILKPEGDLDNRLKTLLDALRLPQDENEVMPPDDPAQKKNCLCLLEDDSLITGLNIQAITSLEDLPKGNVRLSIDVELKAHDLQG
ncbi:hypothetical protein [Candidatus Binatus sp.]|uniref:hypothetical protein n=1 Tax=Candidatus Binatus sp. TaxID=2811406 RepID=UPI002F949E4E